MSKPLSDDIIKLFTGVFRFILPNVNPDNKEELSPGELGINYDTGVFYFKDPYTNEIRTPNSIEALKFIEEHYNYLTGELTADRIGDLRIYSNVTHVPDIDSINEVTIDTIISKMVHPAMLLSHVETDSYIPVGLPARQGLLSITKINEYATSLMFYDSENLIAYIGQYDPATRQFLYWAPDDDSKHNFAIASGNGTSQQVTVTQTIEDLFVLTLKLTNDVQPTATWTFNDSKEYTLVDLYGNPLEGELLAENSIIMLIYDELTDRWILADMKKNIVYQITMLIDKRLRKTTESLPDRVGNIESWLVNDANKFSVVNDVFTCTEDNTTTIPVSNFDINADVLLVNYNQTILRFGIDYSVNEEGTSISLLTSTLNANDTVQLIVIKQSKFVIS
nr:MAG TPA: hypothetical protein [Caudoviricetes sp.]